MATLVQFLASGVNGAANGSATFLLRGTASSAQSVMYNEFEAITQPASNVVTLDANGAAEVYVEAYVDVTLRTSSGDILRTVTVGNSAPLVEVQSTSFTGTDYDGSPANTVGEPITLKAVLDRWIDSAGAPDFEVLSNGVATTIQSALAATAGMFINVKDPTYGATGDGVTDDTTAILAAVAASASAGGGIVFFPPGTYQVTVLDPNVLDVVLMGCGDESSIIRGTSAGTFLLKFTDNTPASSKRITGLGFVASAAYEALVDIEQSQTIAIDNCKFDCTNVSDAAIRRLDFDGQSNVAISNTAIISVGGDSAIQNLADDGESFIALNSCRIILTSSFTGNAIDGPDFSMAQCSIDGSAVTSGTYYHVSAESNEVAGRFLGSFIGNKFYDGGSDGFAFNLNGLEEGSSFKENNNEFDGFTDPTDIEDIGHIYNNSGNSATLLDCDVRLGSRVGKVIRFTVSGVSTVSANASLMAESLVVTFEDNGAFSIIVDGDLAPPGSPYAFTVLNESGSTNHVLFFSGGNPVASVLNVGDGQKALCYGANIVESAGNGSMAVFGTNFTS